MSGPRVLLIGAFGFIAGLVTARCFSGRCRRCASRVRESILSPFHLIGRPRGPRMACGWGCGACLTEHHTDRAPLKPAEACVIYQALPAFPRSADRGPIEAAVAVRHVRSAPASSSRINTVLKPDGLGTG